MLLVLALIPLLSAIIIYTGLLGYNQTINLEKNLKKIGLLSSIINFNLAIVIFLAFDYSEIGYQFVLEYHNLQSFDFYLGVDGISIYFILLTTFIVPIAILSNYTNFKTYNNNYIVILLLLETLLLLVFMVLDVLLFYIFFESILPPLFIFIGLFGSSQKVRAGYYLFLYTLFGSLFLLLSIVKIYAISGSYDYDLLHISNFDYQMQTFLFCGIAIAFAVKTPVIFLNTWLLKAHVESPLSGSILLAAIVLKLSLYGIFRLILPFLCKAYLTYTYIIYVVCVITIIYASLSTIRTIDVKELIAYSSVSHAAVYLIGIFSNTIIGIEGAIALGLAHGFVSSGLFVCAGGILYDRSGTRLISFYRGMSQIMPIFSILFLILSLANCGAPLTFNFLGEFFCLYGSFERLPILGIFASTSIVFSAAYTMYLFNRISFGGSLSPYFKNSVIDVNYREFLILGLLALFTVGLGIYPSLVLDGLHYSASKVIYMV